jgi:hypothetical protein
LDLLFTRHALYQLSHRASRDKNQEENELLLEIGLFRTVDSYLIVLLSCEDIPQTKSHKHRNSKPNPGRQQNTLLS